MSSFKMFLDRNKQISINTQLIVGGGNCTGGGAKNLGNGCWETWTGDYTDTSGTTLCGRMVICKS